MRCACLSELDPSLGFDAVLKGVFDGLDLRDQVGHFD